MKVSCRVHARRCRVGSRESETLDAVKVSYEATKLWMLGEGAVSCGL